MSFSNTIAKHTLFSSFALGSILCVACADQVEPKPQTDNEPGRTSQALDDPGCAVAGVVVGSVSHPVPLPSLCFNDAHGTPEQFASPNGDNGAAGYCPDQAVFEIHAGNWPEGATVHPVVQVGPDAPIQPDATLCSGYSVRVQVFGQAKGASNFFPIGEAGAPMVWDTRTNTCKPGQWNGSWGAQQPTLSPGQWDGVRAWGEVYWNSQNKGVRYSASSQLALVGDRCAMTL